MRLGRATSGFVVSSDSAADVDPHAGAEHREHERGHVADAAAQPPAEIAADRCADEPEQLSHVDSSGYASRRDAASSAFSRKEKILPHFTQAKAPVCAPRSYTLASCGCSHGASPHASCNSCARF